LLSDRRDLEPGESRKEGISMAKNGGNKKKKGGMTVAEAGRKGGQKVRAERGHEFYEEIGRKGGKKVRDLIAAGKKALSRGR
jgi:general stress protein YciG